LTSKKNPFGITERACKKSDFRFFTGLVENSLKKYIESYYKFDRSILEDRFFKEYCEVRILLKGRRRIGMFQHRKAGKGTLEIVKIFLIPSYQGKGIGTWYMQSFERLGCKKLILQVWENNPARYLYKKLGYKQAMRKSHKIHMEKRVG
jgi:GNAT superfamily N-acetyltransferase